jgi:rare lipoprotein A
MADGHRMDPGTNVAASKTLPIGSTAKVTNLENGKTVTVTIEDRGPFVNGRVVDVSPQVAQQLALKKSGVAPVIVKPITVPQPGGGVKLGAGAANASPQEVAKAAHATEKVTGQTADQASNR